MKHISELGLTINLNLVCRIQNTEDKVTIYFEDGKTLEVNCGSIERARELHKIIIGQ